MRLQTTAERKKGGAMQETLLYLGAVLPILWGISHLFPTANVVRGFGEISLDNKRIITMEWINETATLVFAGVLVGVVTIIDHEASVATAAYIVSFGLLNVLSVISLFTGFRIDFLPFRLCPVIFTGSSILILLGALL
jgi:CHASE2 domain-containing sensor protein